MVMGGDILQVQGINSKGYGMIPKMVMQDKRLTVQAKAIYGYFCSFAGAGKTAFPNRDKIIHDLQISKGCYYKHFALLKDCGYIKVEQVKNKQGFFTRNIYTIVESVPCTKICDTEEKHTPPCTKLRDTVKRCTDIKDTNINSIKINSIKINSQSSQTVPDGQTDVQAYQTAIRTRIGFDDLLVTHPEDIHLINEFVDIILDAVLSKSETVRISGENKPRELVRSNLMKLGYDNILHVLGQFKSHQTQIKKKPQYILTMLYHSGMELESHYTNLVNSDWGRRDE